MFHTDVFSGSDKFDRFLGIDPKEGHAISTEVQDVEDADRSAKTEEIEKVEIWLDENAHLTAGKP